MSELLLNEEGNRDINELFLSQLSSGIFCFVLFHISALNSSRAALSPSRFLGARRPAVHRVHLQLGGIEAHGNREGHVCACVCTCEHLQVRGCVCTCVSLLESKEDLSGSKHELEVASPLALSLSEMRQKIRPNSSVTLGPLWALCPGGLSRVASLWDQA